MTLMEARKNARYSRREVARKLDVAYQTVLNWELNKSQPNVTQFRSLCSLYGCKGDDIFFEQKVK